MKNKKLQRTKIFGRASTPPPRSIQRQKHLNHIMRWTQNFLGVPCRITPGKFNKSGKFIKKPDWTSGFLEFEPNPDAAVHEIAHLFLADIGLGLGDIQKSMDNQFGLVIKYFGYQKQKRSLFEVLPMGVEQRIRRVLGLPPSRHGVIVDPKAPIRTLIEDKKTVIAKRVKLKSGKQKDLIRLSSNLDALCLERIDKILNRELIFDLKRGWIKNNDINSIINLKQRIKQ